MKILLALIIIIGGIICQTPAYAAVYDLNLIEITYPSEPLFFETNISPGFLTSKDIIIENVSDTPQQVGIFFDITNDSVLTNTLTISVLQNGTLILPSQTMKTIADIDEISLGLIDAHSTQIITLSAELPNGASNEYQNKFFVFDIAVGFNTSEGRVLGDTTTRIPKGVVLGEVVTGASVIDFWPALLGFGIVGTGVVFLRKGLAARKH